MDTGNSKWLSRLGVAKRESKYVFCLTKRRVTYTAMNYTAGIFTTITKL